MNKRIITLWLASAAALNLFVGCDLIAGAEATTVSKEKADTVQQEQKSTAQPVEIVADVPITKQDTILITSNTKSSISNPSVTEPAKEPVTDPVKEPVAEPVKEPVTEPAKEPAIEPVTEPVVQPVPPVPVVVDPIVPPKEVTLPQGAYDRRGRNEVWIEISDFGHPIAVSQGTYISMNIPGNKWDAIETIAVGDSLVISTDFYMYKSFYEYPINPLYPRDPSEPTGSYSVNYQVTGLGTATISYNLKYSSIRTVKQPFETIASVTLVVVP